MSPQANPSYWYGNKPKIIYYLLFLSCLVISIITAHPLLAHQVQIAVDVGATLHIEPNDHPRAGEPSQAWFALTRKGGQVIPLTECDCELLIYAQPHVPGEPALITPDLEPVAAERYQGIPGAEIIFPKPGRYQLQLTGKPTTQGNFQPFQFEFDVTVARGTTINAVEQTKNTPTQNVALKSGLTITVLGLVILITVAIAFVLLRVR